MADTVDDPFLSGLFSNNRAWAEKIKRENPHFFDKLAKQPGESGERIIGR